VAYCVHDLEDAIVSGAFDPAVLTAAEVRADVVGVAAAEYAPTLTAAALDDAVGRVAGLDCWLRGFDHSGRSLAALKNMTSRLIRRFCSAAQDATRRGYAGALRRYAADLVVPQETLAEVAVLKAITFIHVMRGNEQRYAWEREVLSEVVAGLQSGRHRLQEPFELALEAAPDDARRLRLIIDQVASLTDLSIVRWRAELAS
jgi:dGTPase